MESVGSFELIFYYLKYTVSKKEGYPYKSINTEERRAVLDRFGGVKIYRDSFRVRPYGDSGNDWLSLGTRVAQSPAGAGQRIGDWRVRPEQTSGVITISRKENTLLVDKSDRGAIQENDAFEAFKNIIKGIIHEFEIDRTKILNPFYVNKKLEDEKKLESSIQARAADLAYNILLERKKSDKKYFGKRQDTPNLFQQTQEEEEIRNYERVVKATIRKIEEANLKKEYEEIVQVRALASLGLIVSSFAHELKEVRDNSHEIFSLESIFNKIVTEEYRKTILFKDGIDIIELLKSDSEKIKYWVNYSLTAIKKDKRKRSKIDLSKYFDSLKKNWEKIFEEKNIKFKIDDSLSNEDYIFIAFEMDLNTIFYNLINNSIDSFDNLVEIRQRVISIVVKNIGNTIEIIYSDNGVGLSSIFEDKEEIFLPFTTSKKDRQGNEYGTGLGMYLVKNVIDDNNGKIEILDPAIGFSIKINLQIRKK